MTRSTPTSRRSMRQRPLAACVTLALAAAGLCLQAEVRAATVPVTSCDDDGPGTLRQVILAAEDGDTLDLTGLTCGTIELASLIDISVIALPKAPLLNVTVQGPGRDKLTISGADATAILRHGGNGTDGWLTLADLTVANGRATNGLASCVQSYANIKLERVSVRDCHSQSNLPVNFGGAVGAYGLEMVQSAITGSTSASNTRSAIGGGAYVGYTATLVDSVISGNHVTVATPGANSLRSGGGGIYARGPVEITRSTISGNSIEAGQYGRGGGLLLRGSAVLVDSLVEGNVASADGGGVHKANYTNYGDQITSLRIDNTSISGNTARRGGGVSTTRPTTVRSSTIAFNEAAEYTGGLLYVHGGATTTVVFDLQSSLFGSNQAVDTVLHGADFGVEGATIQIGGGHNLIVDADASLLPPGTLRDEPLLLPLADNGGPTRTHALGKGSPAIDAGNNTGAFAFDQRGEGFARERGGGADIGAFEAPPPPAEDTLFKNGFEDER